MKGLPLTLSGALFCVLTLLASRQGLVGAQAIAPRSTGTSDAAERLRIGAFNIQVFGVSKLESSGVLTVLVDVSLCTQLDL